MKVDTVVVGKRGFINAYLLDEWLFVYRSPLVRDEDKAFQPVRQLLNQRDHRIVLACVFDDEDMMFGEGHFTVYQLGEKMWK